MLRKYISTQEMEGAYTSMKLVSIYQTVRYHNRSRDSIVGMATGMGWMREGSEFESHYSQEFSFLHVVQTGSGAHPASYPMGTGGSFPGGEAAGA
jgi:hypothetical protein